MSTEARLSAIEARLAAIESRMGGGTAPAPDNSGAAPSDVFPDSMLEKDWADKVIARESKQWSGESQVGRRYSDAPAEWHDAQAGLLEWKAKKGREETPVRMKNNGKPWHEADSFEAKLHRTWARRIRSQGAAGHSQPAPRATPKPAPAAQYDDFGGADADEIPFAVSHDVGPRHVRRRDRWAKW